MCCLCVVASEGSWMLRVICEYVFMRVWVNMFVHAFRGQRLVSVVSLNQFWKQDLLLNMQIISWLCWLAPEIIYRPVQHPLPSAGVTGVHHHTQHLHRYSGSNPGSHAFTAFSLPTETPSLPQMSTWKVKKYQWLIHLRNPQLLVVVFCIICSFIWFLHSCKYSTDNKNMKDISVEVSLFQKLENKGVKSVICSVFLMWPFR